MPGRPRRTYTLAIYVLLYTEAPIYRLLVVIAAFVFAARSNALRTADLAAHVQMSPSSLHHYFRRLTAMSPLQYQKWLRLSEAKRLMLNENLDAGRAAFDVGYESPSQFSREYSGAFGAPPKRDIEGLRQAGEVNGRPGLAPA